MTMEVVQSPIFSFAIWDLNILPLSDKMNLVSKIFGNGSGRNFKHLHIKTSSIFSIILKIDQLKRPSQVSGMGKKQIATIRMFRSKSLLFCYPTPSVNAILKTLHLYFQIAILMRTLSEHFR